MLCSFFSTFATVGQVLLAISSAFCCNLNDVFLELSRVEPVPQRKTLLSSFCMPSDIRLLKISWESSWWLLVLIHPKHCECPTLFNFFASPFSFLSSLVYSPCLLFSTVKLMPPPLLKSRWEVCVVPWARPVCGLLQNVSPLCSEVEIANSHAEHLIESSRYFSAKFLRGS